MRLKALALSVVAVLGAMLAPATASAAPGNTVLLGDSIMANPSVAHYMSQRGIPLDPKPLNGVGCASDDRFKNAYASVKRAPVDNYSCSGASFRTGGKHITSLANKARQDGKLNGATREVVIFAGANDTYPYILNDKMPIPQIENNLRVSIRNTVNHVKRLAPNARVKVMGYPRITNPAGQTCYLNLLPQGTPSLIVKARPVEDALQRAAANASRDTRSTFVDIKPMTTGHDTCARDRWITGIIDVAPQHRNLAFHLTHHGITEVAKHTARV
ncbi:GDSL-type esterase/lipase family protein [Corynebacterium urealyticum]|uniref:SGNH hydrolase-type esterase domain-containing protein n=1 Tax=Corynebacterium urealyticum (strain ATCC 43042 / DSM 7109) TaxID=504474 RepID=B1VIK1_CORU7|nr:GDSL-type esterase/lipase family protein [Corynebacterium urealyticum]AGE37152.1 hypothetical protein CU7111_1566 [Corynebacterium urealyticum DSM 7111]QQB07021.1 hypothetical protein I6H53_06735 [Corynebacterium urealyticum]QQC42821.1 hypothetical protein I6H51_04510 [Corynebacterium urealyticum]CAQ05585.1 hypothetical protein cu1625 [Corynebacterium urealyticum DSM 7109]SNV89722.1 secreted esterase A [Corynebacterium urealyticum]